MSMKKNDPKFLAAYDRAMLRSEFLSLFWNVFTDRKAKDKLTLEQLAKKTGSSKHEVSRWFNGDPNWTINTIASLAGALGVTLKIEALDADGKVFSASGATSKPTRQTQQITSSVSVEQPIMITKSGNFTKSTTTARVA
jgi:transcriptional regulator with XRE-family HTH domain